ncbi:MAG: DNA repair protein RecN, partial [Nitrospirota bacterium]
MLKELRIKDFAIVDSLDLSFSNNLNILTGETGAGKSIIIDAVDLSLGGKASPEHIRSGSDEAVIEALFDLPDESPARARLSDMGILKGDETEIVVRRLISRSGRGKVFVNGGMLNLSTLKELMDGIVDIHGQHEHQSLLNRNRHIDLLDAYGRLEDKRVEFGKDFLRIKDLNDELSGLEKDEAERIKRVGFINFMIDEITGGGLKADEEEELLRDKKILSNSERLARLSDSVLQDLYESGDPLFTRLQAIKSSLREMKEADPAIDDIERIWDEVIIQAKEAAMLIRGYGSRIDHDPARLEQINERLDLIGRLKKKYGSTIEEILDDLSRKRIELDELNSREEKIGKIREDIEEATRKAYDLANVLSKGRRNAANRLEGVIEKELSSLKMERTRFIVDRVQREELDSRGIDRIEFLISPNPGEEPKPLSSVASGGELSRIMLALKSALAGVDDVPTLIFDEIDAGIGGGVAEMVGKRLYDLSKGHQVFCITHLPQIASFAQSHYYVEKVEDGGRTVTRVSRLSEKERISEIARMLGG